MRVSPIIDPQFHKYEIEGGVGSLIKELEIMTTIGCSDFLENIYFEVFMPL